MENGQSPRNAATLREAARVMRQPKLKRFYIILYQSKLMHSVWDVWDCARMQPETAANRFASAARLFGKKHVRLMVSDDETMRKAMKEVVQPE